MQPSRTGLRRRGFTSPSLLLPVVLCLLIARDAPGRTLPSARRGAEALLAAAPREARLPSWAAILEPIEVISASTGASARISLYDRRGEVNGDERAAFERIASRETEPHRLSPRVEQLVFKAAYHFRSERVFVVSAWRENAGKHTIGEAIDFRLQGVRPASVAAYLRGLPRVGVGIYTHPRTQFVHVDVRDASYHWLDASPPGVNWRERPMCDRGAVERDASYASEMDLP